MTAPSPEPVTPTPAPEQTPDLPPGYTVELERSGRWSCGMGYILRAADGEVVREMAQPIGYVEEAAWAHYGRAQFAAVSAPPAPAGEPTQEQREAAAAYFVKACPQMWADLGVDGLAVELDLLARLLSAREGALQARIAAAEAERDGAHRLFRDTQEAWATRAETAERRAGSLADALRDAESAREADAAVVRAETLEYVVKQERMGGFDAAADAAYWRSEARQLRAALTAPAKPTPTPLPCPWCGSPAEVVGVEREPLYRVDCENGDCGAGGPDKTTEAAAVAAWNGAVAHDRQPYPTAAAYQAVCAARDKWQSRADALAGEARRLIAMYDDPHPGLASWASMWGQAFERLRRVLAAETGGTDGEGSE